MYFFLHLNLLEMRLFKPLCVISVAIVLAACGGMPVEPESAEPAALLEQQLEVQQRQSQLALLKNWRLNGRIALITDDEAWSGQILWHQIADDYLIQFSAPSGQGAMQLSGSKDGVELRLANGDIYSAKDADSLLRQETTWELPIQGLWYWVRGLPDPQLTYKVTLGEQGRIKELTQDDWLVQYDRYQLYNNHYFPRKIVIQSSDIKVRLIVTAWKMS